MLDIVFIYVLYHIMFAWGALCWTQFLFMYCITLCLQGVPYVGHSFYLCTVSHYVCMGCLMLDTVFIYVLYHIMFAWGALCWT